VPTESNSAFSNGGAHSPSLSDVLFQNERAMWWAEFDSIGEQAVRSNVESHSYTPTGMEAARQWLAKRESPQLDVQSIRALAENVQRTASDFLKGELEDSSLASRVDANSRAIVELAAKARKNARATVIIGVATSLFSLCAMAMVLASWRQVAPSTKPPPKQAIVRTSTKPPAEMRHVAPDTEQAPPKQVDVRPLAPAVPAPEIRRTAPTTKQASMSSSRPKQAVARAKPPAVPPAARGQALPPDDAQDEPRSDSPGTESPDLRPERQSLAQVLALIADRMEGTINFTAQFHDMATGRDYPAELSYKTSNVTIDPNRCQVGYHWQVEQDGRTVSDQYRAVELRLANSIRVASIDGESGQRYSVRSDPKVYVVHIARANNASGDDLYFRDRDMAERVGMATRSAVELCGNRDQQFRPR